MAENSETLAPVRMQRVANSVPWTVVGLLLLAGAQAGTTTMSKVIGYGGAVLAMVVSVRAARLRLMLGPEVVVVGWLGTRRYPWSEIDKFVINDRGLAIRMRGGLEINVPAYPMGTTVLKKMRDSVTADLEQIQNRAESFRKQRRGK